MRQGRTVGLPNPLGSRTTRSQEGESEVDLLKGESDGDSGDVIRAKFNLGMTVSLRKALVFYRRSAQTERKSTVDCRYLMRMLLEKANFGRNFDCVDSGLG